MQPSTMPAALLDLFCMHKQRQQQMQEQRVSSSLRLMLIQTPQKAYVFNTCPDQDCVKVTAPASEFHPQT